MYNSIYHVNLAQGVFKIPVQTVTTITFHSSNMILCTTLRGARFVSSLTTIIWYDWFRGFFLKLTKNFHGKIEPTWVDAM